MLIADSVGYVEEAQADPSVGKIPKDAAMFQAVPSMLETSLALPGKHTWIEFFAPYQIKGAAGTGLNGTGWTEESKNQAASGMPGRKCARVFLHNQRPIAQTLADMSSAVKSTAKSVLNIK
ncbi:hypothetical protein H6F79_22330 [Trichocoleus sp. FACHB-69]|nr:hypothetical protein [Trichocoleus sp. FACHB-69]